MSANQQALDFLPEPLDGMLVNLNDTDAGGRLADGALTSGRSIPLAASSRRTINGVLGYEKGPVRLRFSGAYRSAYLDEVGEAADEDCYVKNHFQLDLTAKYRRGDLDLRHALHCYSRLTAETGKTVSATARADGKVQGPVYLVSVTGSKMYGLNDRADTQPDRLAEDTQLYQVIDVEADRLALRTRTTAPDAISCTMPSKD